MAYVISKLHDFHVLQCALWQNGWLIKDTWEQRAAAPFPQPLHVVLIFLWVTDHFFFSSLLQFAAPQD